MTTTHAPHDRHRPVRCRVPSLLALVMALVAGLVATAGSAAASPGAPWFMPYFYAESPHVQQSRGATYHPAKQYYTHNFPDPDILRDGDTYYAYGTSTGGAYLPVMTSTDLVNWAPRRPYDADELDPRLVPAGKDWMFGDEWFNDALLQPAAWGGDFPNATNPRMTKELWAPGVEKFGDTYVAFYAVRMPASAGERYCLSVAVADAPIGPFYDTSTKPLHCDVDPEGSIDPEPFVDPATGTPYLLWKSEGTVDVHPPRIYVRELAPSGTAFAPGSSATMLLTQTPEQAWEGHVVENPSMVRHGGQYYLFYSGNEWASADYGTGYALCESVTGPCVKPRTTPLMGSSAALGKIGAGGASAFLDADGALRLAYHSWQNATYTGYPADQRRMAITQVTGSGKALAVGSDAPAGPPPAVEPATPTVLTPDQACPVGVVPADAFADDDGNAHERAIDCVRWWGVTAGKDGRYEPLGQVTRAQMATFLANAIDRSGGTLSETATDFFSDDNGTPHERNINRLAAVGVVGGKGGGTYAPGALVTREQMATFLVKAVKERTGVVLSSSVDYFADDAGSPHAGNINAAAAAGLASGSGSGSYSPGVTVRRDQMASFLARVLEFYVDRGAPLPAQ